MNKSSIRINQEIKSSTVRLIDQNSNQVGIVELKEAQKLADDANLDLVELAPNSKPPVVKILDFGKYKYELAKKEKETRKKQHTITTKEVRLRPKIEEHDFMFKLRNARKFLEAGDRVKVSLFFRGREFVHKELGFQIMERFKNEVEDIAKIERGPKMEGNQIILFLIKK